MGHVKFACRQHLASGLNFGHQVPKEFFDSVLIVEKGEGSSSSSKFIGDKEGIAFAFS